MNAYDRVDLHDRIMDLLRGRIKMGAGVSAGRKRRVGRPRVAKRRRAGVETLSMAGDYGMDMLDGAGRRRRKRVVRKRAGVPAGGKRRVGRPRVHRRRAGDDCGGDGDCGGEGMRRRRVVRRRRAGSGLDGGARKRRRAGAAASPWVAYVKKYAKAHNMDYGEAMSKAGPSYRRMHH